MCNGSIRFVAEERVIMNGFLDTEGKLHPCEHYEHLDLAFDIVEEMGVIVHNRLEAEEYLQKLGWVCVRTNDVYGLIGCFKDIENGKEERYHLTKEQREWFNNNYENMTMACRESVDVMFDWDL